MTASAEPASDPSDPIPSLDTPTINYGRPGPSQTAIDQAFNSSRTSGTQPPGTLTPPILSTNAPLDRDTIQRLARGIVSRDPQVATGSLEASADAFTVAYSVDQSVQIAETGEDTVFVEFTQCATPAMAQERMKDFLAGFEGPLDEAVRKPESRLGSNTLQTDNSVFWVRDTVFAEVSCDDIGDLSSSSIVEDPADTPQSITMASLFRFAETIDQHLAENAVLPDAQTKPHPVLQTASPFEVKQGQPFTLKLQDVNDAHVLKPAEIDHPDLTYLAKNGSATGEYEFFALKAGRTRVRLLVAHKTLLTVTAVEVQVIITDE